MRKIVQAPENNPFNVLTERRQFIISKPPYIMGKFVLPALLAKAVCWAWLCFMLLPCCSARSWPGKASGIPGTAEGEGGGTGRAARESYWSKGTACCGPESFLYPSKWQLHIPPGGTVPKSPRGEEKNLPGVRGDKTLWHYSPSSKREPSMWQHKVPHIEETVWFSKLEETGLRMGL